MVTTLEDLRYTICLTLLEARCTVVYCLFLISPCRGLLSLGLCQMWPNIFKCTVKTVFWLTAISTNLPCILSMISGARHKRVFNLVYYSLPCLCTFVVLAKTAKATCSIIFYCFIQHYLSRQEDISLLAVDHKPAEIFPSYDAMKNTSLIGAKAKHSTELTCLIGGLVEEALILR